MFPTFSLWKSDPQAQLYFSLSIIVLCSPLHKLCFRVFHIVPFTLGIIAFYALLMFLLRFSEVQRWYKAVLFAVFNSLLFQRYLRMCMRTENLLSSNKRGTNFYRFLFSFSTTTVYLGQFFHEPNMLPVFIDALTFILILVYFQLRCSALFELPAEATPLSWSSTLAMFTRQLGLESPLQNRLGVHESYEYMMPRLDILYMWRSLREAVLRPFRTYGLIKPKIPPVPPESGGAGLIDPDILYTGLVGTAIAAGVGTAASVGVHINDYEQRERHHQDNLLRKDRDLAVQEQDVSLQKAELRLHEIDQLKELSRDYRSALQTEEFKLKSLAHARTPEAISQRLQYEEAIQHYKESLRNTESRLSSFFPATPTASEVVASASQKPPTVYSCFEPSFKGGTLEAECITHATYCASLETFIALIV